MYEERRNWRKVSPETLGPVLLADPLELFGDPIRDVATFNNWVSSALDRVAPLKTMKLARIKPSAPWFSAELRLEKSKCKKLERAWRKTYNPEAKSRYCAALKKKKFMG